MTTITHKKSFLIDPNANSSLDTTSLWTSTTGTITVSSGDLLFNADAGITKKWFVHGIFTFRMHVPAAPTTGDVREWGLKTLGYGDKGRMTFNIIDDVLTAKAYDAQGVLIESFAIPWDADWTDADVDFVIDWRPGAARFAIGLTNEPPTTYRALPTGKIVSSPMSIYVNNANADNMLVDFISVDGCEDIGSYN